MASAPHIDYMPRRVPNWSDRTPSNDLEAGGPVSQTGGRLKWPKLRFEEETI